MAFVFLFAMLILAALQAAYYVNLYRKCGTYMERYDQGKISARFLFFWFGIWSATAVRSEKNWKVFCLVGLVIDMSIVAVVLVLVIAAAA